MSSFLFKLGQRCARHPWRVLVGWLAVAAVVIGVNVQLGGSTKGQLHRPRRRGPSTPTRSWTRTSPSSPASPASSCSTSPRAGSPTAPTRLVAPQPERPVEQGHRLVPAAPVEGGKDLPHHRLEAVDVDGLRRHDQL